MNVLVVFAVFSISCTKPAPSNPSFEQDIVPIIKSKCIACHNDLWLNKQTFHTKANILYKRLIIERTMPPSGLSKYQYNTIKNYLDNILVK